VILDSSAIVAIFIEEPAFELLLAKAESATFLAVGAPTLLETRIALARKQMNQANARLDEFLLRSGVRILSFDEEHLRVAFQAFLRFGKGRHPAQLNFGDCFSYATSRVSEQPLLYTGDDFAKTDIEAA
jgi:ribonuclease VapC